MPTVEEYSLFLNGILKTAQDKVNAKGKLDCSDVQTLFEIAKFTDGHINEDAASDLAAVYETHYQNMTPDAIKSLEMFTVTHAINGYMWKNKGNWSQWYVGLTTDDAIEDKLFVEHQVSKAHGFWIHQSLSTTTTAQAILDYYLKNGAQGGIHGVGNTARKIYAFKLAAVPKKENSFSRVSLDPKPVNPNRKVHDLDPQNYRQCPACYGSGWKTCSSCGGSGGRSESRVEYDWNNDPIYNTEWVSCYACTGGQTTCNTCGGSGTVTK